MGSMMNKSEIEKWLKKYGIENYTIHDNLVVDVNGDVYLCNKILTELPFQFGNVTGYFHCSNNKLTSLQYCPASVDGSFYCFDNPFIVTKENESNWLEAIKHHKKVYSHIKEPTEGLINFYKLLYEV